MIQSHEMSRDALSRLRSTREVRKAKRTQPSVRGAHRRALDARHSVSAAMNLAHQTLRVGTGFPALARRATGADRARARATRGAHGHSTRRDSRGCARSRGGLHQAAPGHRPIADQDGNHARGRRRVSSLASAGASPHPHPSHTSRATRPAPGFGSSETTRTVPCWERFHLTPGETPRAATRTPSREPRVDRGDAFLLTQNRPRAYCGAREARPRPRPGSRVRWRSLLPPCVTNFRGGIAYLFPVLTKVPSPKPPPSPPPRPHPVLPE